MTKTLPFDESIEIHDFEAPTFEAALNAHGMYETMRFVLRLSPRNHALMDGIENGQYVGRDLSPDVIRAYSTYLHETIHWWQHVGSTSGLMLSLSYLGQSHSSIEALRAVLARLGPKKSLFRFTNEALLAEGEAAQEWLASANVAVNNALDIEYFKAFALTPSTAAPWLVAQQHFESIGHCYHIAYGSVVSMLQRSVDRGVRCLPDGQAWDIAFTRLTNAKIEGFYHGSPLRRARVGLKAIYEGQARFAQLQFLNGASGPYTCEEIDAAGYFSGIYVEAFEHFLELTQSKWPEFYDDPLIGLFLLVCDVAINPTRGFPLEIVDFEHFILDVDVGIRFSRLSLAIIELPHLKEAIQDYTREEYLAVSRELTFAVGYDDPLEALEVIETWRDKLPSLAQLMEEHRTFEFDRENQPIRVFFSHFLALAQDRRRRPDFFCWPGVWKTREKDAADTSALWLRHLSLFSDRPDKPGVYPRNWPHRDPLAVKHTFEQFYGTMALYDLTRQWILKDGPFECDYRWLMENYSQQRADEWASDTFKQVYGIDLSLFEILKP